MPGWISLRAHGGKLAAVALLIAAEAVAAAIVPGDGIAVTHATRAVGD